MSVYMCEMAKRIITACVCIVKNSISSLIYCFSKRYQINCITKADSKVLTNAHRGQIMPHICSCMYMLGNVYLHLCVGYVCNCVS